MIPLCPKQHIVSNSANTVLVLKSAHNFVFHLNVVSLPIAGGSSEVKKPLVTNPVREDTIKKKTKQMG